MNNMFKILGIFLILAAVSMSGCIGEDVPADNVTDVVDGIVDDVIDEPADDVVDDAVEDTSNEVVDESDTVDESNNSDDPIFWKDIAKSGTGQGSNNDDATTVEDDPAEEELSELELAQVAYNYALAAVNDAMDARDAAEDNVTITETDATELEDAVITLAANETYLGFVADAESLNVTANEAEEEYTLAQIALETYNGPSEAWNGTLAAHELATRIAAEEARTLSDEAALIPEGMMDEATDAANAARVLANEAALALEEAEAEVTRCNQAAEEAKELLDELENPVVDEPEEDPENSTEINESVSEPIVNGTILINGTELI